MNILKSFPIIKYLPLVLLFPVALNFILFSFDSGLSYGDGNVWLAFWGNYTGGLISAVVAYFVANSQIKKQVSLDLEQRYFQLATNQLPALIRLRIEMERFIPELEKIKKENDYFYDILMRQNKDSGEDVEPKIHVNSSVFPDELLKKIFNYVDLLDKETMKYLEKVEDIDLQIELINAFDFYDKFSRSLNFDFHLADEEKDELLMRKLAEDIPNSVMESQLFNIDMEMRKALKERREGYKALYDENKIDSLKETLTHLTKEIDRSYRIKKSGTMGV